MAAQPAGLYALLRSVGLCLCCGCVAVEDDFAPLPDPRPEPVVFACPDAALRVGSAGNALDSIPLKWIAGAGQSYVHDYVYLRLPEELVSLSLVVDFGTVATGVRRVLHDGKVLLDGPSEAFVGETAPFFHQPAPGASLLFPMGDGPPPVGGCLAVDPYALGAHAGASATLHVLTRRGSPGVTLPVDVVLVDEVELAASDLEHALMAVDALYAQHGGPRIGEVQVHRLDWSGQPVTLDAEDEYALRAAFQGERAAMTVYVVEAFTERDTLGITAGIPGANGVYGTAATGMLVALDPHRGRTGQLDTGLLAETIAHEGGHQLGLFHTTEPEGLDFDPLGDTPQCAPSQDSDGDGELSAAECLEQDGGNFMFWSVREDGSQRQMSPRQAAVLRANPVVGAGSPAYPANTAAPPQVRSLLEDGAPTTQRIALWLGRLSARHARPMSGPHLTAEDVVALCVLQDHARYRFVAERARRRLDLAGQRCGR